MTVEQFSVRQSTWEPVRLPCHCLGDVTRCDPSWCASRFSEHESRHNTALAAFYHQRINAHTFRHEVPINVINLFVIGTLNHTHSLLSMYIVQYLLRSLVVSSGN